jgi:hypothetical protein
MKVRIIKYTYQTLAYNKTKYHIQYKFFFWWKTLFVPDFETDKYILATVKEESEKETLIGMAKDILIGDRYKYTIVIEPEVEVIFRNFTC